MLKTHANVFLMKEDTSNYGEILNIEGLFLNEGDVRAFRGGGGGFNFPETPKARRPYSKALNPQPKDPLGLTSSF